MKLIFGLLVMLSLLNAQNIKIASYNVENLFDLEYDGGEYEEYIPNTSWKWNAKTYKAKLQNISQVIKDINPDIIALQEIESLQALLDLKRQLKFDGLYFQYYAIAKAKNTTVKNAILSKVPVITSKEIVVTSSRKYRNVLEATFKLGNEKLYMYVVHPKAKSGPESARIITAKALKRRLDEIKDENIIVLGDFNSDFDEYKKFLKKRKLNDTNGKTALQHILKSVDENNDHITLSTLKAPYMYNPWIELDEEDRFTHKFKRFKESLDNVLISHRLHDNKGLEYIEGSFNKFDEKYLLKRGAPYRWQRSKKPPFHHVAKGYSDHLPIYFTINTN